MSRAVDHMLEARPERKTNGCCCAIHHWSLAPLRVRGIERVRLHADLTILATLSCALVRARAVPLAA